MDIFFEGLIGSAFYRELALAGLGIKASGIDKSILVPKLILVPVEDELQPEFFAFSHVVEDRPHFVWGLVCLWDLDPHLAYFDTRIFEHWAEDKDCPPWNELYSSYRYTGEFTLQQLLEASATEFKKPEGSLLAVIDALKMI